LVVPLGPLAVLLVDVVDVVAADVQPASVPMSDAPARAEKVILF
jgi:hypothetical protein